MTEFLVHTPLRRAMTKRYVRVNVDTLRVFPEKKR
jgi:hypothetical protein